MLPGKRVFRIDADGLAEIGDCAIVVALVAIFGTAIVERHGVAPAALCDQPRARGDAVFMAALRADGPIVCGRTISGCQRREEKETENQCNPIPHGRHPASEPAV